MKLVIALVYWVVLFGLSLPGNAGEGEPTGNVKHCKEDASYAIGVDLVRNFKRQGIEFDVDSLVKGLQDAAAGRKLVMPEAELRDVITKVQTEQRLKMAQHRGRSPAEVNQRVGAEFLALNKTQPGVVCLPSGLQYKVLKAGSGPKPQENDTVAFNYRTTGLDGTEFNCSNPGQPGTFKVKEVETAAWREALLLMPVGAKWQLFIPPSLGYGAAGVGKTIAPNETLIAELELVAIK